MPRLTITVSEETHRALKETAFQQRKTIRQIIEESLDFYGIKTEDQAWDILEKARKNANMTEKEALDLAVQETRTYRQSQKK